MKARDCKINGSGMGVVSKVSRSKLYGSKSSIVVNRLGVANQKMFQKILSKNLDD